MINKTYETPAESIERNHGFAGAAFLMLCVLVWATGCSSTMASKQPGVDLARTEAQSMKPSDATQIAALQQQMAMLASQTSDVQGKGLSVWNRAVQAERNPDGSIWVNPATGNPVFGISESRTTWNSAHEAMGGFDEATLDIGHIDEITPGTNQQYAAPGQDAFHLSLKGVQGGVQQNADAIRAPYEGRALEKAASSEALARALAADYAGRVQLLNAGVDGMVKIVDVTGREIVGRVVRVNPVAAAADVAEKAAVVYLENRAEPVVVAQPPAEAPAE